MKMKILRHTQGLYPNEIPYCPLNVHCSIGIYLVQQVAGLSMAFNHILPSSAHRFPSFFVTIRTENHRKPFRNASGLFGIGMRVANAVCVVHACIFRFLLKMNNKTHQRWMRNDRFSLYSEFNFVSRRCGTSENQMDLILSPFIWCNWIIEIFSLVCGEEKPWSVKLCGSFSSFCSHFKFHHFHASTNTLGTLIFNFHSPSLRPAPCSLLNFKLL